MSKCITKKALTLFLAFIVLTQFSSAKAMKFFSCLRHSIEKDVTNLPAETTITKKNRPTNFQNLPDDCIYVILKHLDWKNILDLKLVGKELEHTIKRVTKKYPCFSTNVNVEGCPGYLHYLLKRGSLVDFTVLLLNENVANNFLHATFLSKVKEKRLKICMRLNKEPYVKFLSLWREKLNALLLCNKNRLVYWEIRNDKHPEEFIAMLPARKDDNKSVVTFKKKLISPDELKLLSVYAHALHIGDCNNKTFELPSIEAISIANCPNLRCLKTLKDYKKNNKPCNVKKLKIIDCSKFDVKGLTEMTGLLGLSIYNCPKFDPKKLGSTIKKNLNRFDYHIHFKK